MGMMRDAGSSSELTVLNMMPSRDFDTSLELHRQWGLHWVDLWGDIYGIPSVDLLDLSTAARAADAIAAAGLEVYCQSTRVFDDHVEVGEQDFRRAHLDQLGRSLKMAERLKPAVVRLIAGRLTRGDDDASSVRTLKHDYPWIAAAYRDGVKAIRDAGYDATIENETGDCFLASTEEFLEFFEWLDLGSEVTLTWDVQNNWQTGYLPTLGRYESLKPLIGYVHLKGGQSEPGSTALRWKTSLADASWPVLDIAQAVVDDGVSPLVCLNPSHGAAKDGYDYGIQASDRDVSAITLRDLEYLRENVTGLR